MNKQLSKRAASYGAKQTPAWDFEGPVGRVLAKQYMIQMFVAGYRAAQRDARKAKKGKVKR